MIVDTDSLIGAALDELAAAPPSTKWPSPLAPEAFHGLVGEIVRAIEPHTEADPAALLIQFLCAFGNVTGRGAYFRAEADKHHTNLFCCLVGQTSKGRKGTSWGYVRDRFAGIDKAWLETRVLGGLSSGEGLIWSVRDPIHNGDGAATDPGEPDKRLLVVEPEFARVLGACERDTNTLSAVIRQAWDDGALRILTKKQAATALTAHITLIAHVTKDELRRLLTDTATVNGFANRFLWICCKRSKMLPEGGALPSAAMAKLDDRLRESVQWAMHSRELRRDKEAREAWVETYASLSAGKPGLLGAATSRAEAQTMRLATIYAAIDRSEYIRLEHLLAGLAVWEYAERSAAFIFGDAIGDRVADDISQALKVAGSAGMTRAEIRELFGRHKSSEEIGRALSVLEEYGMAKSVNEPTAGRPIERWLAAHVQGAR